MAGAQDQPSTHPWQVGSQDHGEVCVTISRVGCRGPNTAQVLVLSLPGVPCQEGPAVAGRVRGEESPSSPGGPWRAGRGNRRGPPGPTAPWHLPTLSRPPWNPWASAAVPQEWHVRSHRSQMPTPSGAQPEPGAHPPALCLPPACFISSGFAFPNFTSPPLPAASGHSFVQQLPSRGP